MIQAVNIVRQRLNRVATALVAADIQYAVIGDNAISAWIARTDPSAVRNTFRTEILLNRTDFDKAKASLSTAGFVHDPKESGTPFLDGCEGKRRNAVQLLFTGERVRSEDTFIAPSISMSQLLDGLQVLNLDPLVRMQLESNRTNDRVNICDLIDVGLVDASWLPQLPSELAERLQLLLDDPEG